MKYLKIKKKNLKTIYKQLQNRKELPFRFRQWGKMGAMIILGKHQTNPKENNTAYLDFHRILKVTFETYSAIENSLTIWH